jgi:hypothetical protein
MRNLYLVIGFSFVFCTAQSQQPNCDCPDDEDYSKWLQAGLMGVEYNNPVDGYRGKHFFNTWTLGEVELNNGDVIRNIYLQYDQFQDELMWLRKTDRRIAILSKDYVSGFRLFDVRNELAAVFVRMKVNLPYSGLREAYLQLLVPGNPALYAYRNSTVMTSDNKLVEKSTYFITGDRKGNLVKLSRKSLTAFPAVKKAEIKAVLRSDRSGSKNEEEGLTRVIQR